MTELAAFSAAAVLSWLGVAMLLRRSQDLLDVPNERSMHAVPTPRGGGLPIAVFLAVAVAVAAGPARPVAGLLQGGLVLLVAAVGMVDDLRSLPWRTRMAVHLVAAVGAVLLWGSLTDLAIGGADRVVPAPMALALMLVWTVGLLNAYNFMDGIDGIAGVQAMAAGATWAALAALGGADGLAPAMASVAGAAAGFLAWNWHPARIFMGDVGSTALGYTFAVLPAIGVARGTVDPPTAPWVALGAVFPFVYDAVSTFVRRAIRRENVFAAHRTHTYQLLAVRLGHRPVAALWGAMALGTGAVAVAFAVGAAGEGAAWASLAAVVVTTEALRRWAVDTSPAGR